MSLRAKLLAGAAGIVLVSLFLSGVLAWVLVRNLEFDASTQQLRNASLSYRNAILQQECSQPGVAFCAPGDRASPAEFQGRLDRLAQSLSGGDRMLLLNRNSDVVYDSAANAATGSTLQLASSEGDLSIGNSGYIFSRAQLRPGRDPFGAAWVVLARSHGAVAAGATNALVPRLMLAAVIALVVALVAAMLLSRAIAGPLTELASAADDIAAGNYSRRVDIKGSDEIGLLGSAFNRMAYAVDRARTAQRDFVANVSHELKTPLTSLLGFSQALVDGSLRSEAEKQRAAVILHEEAERVLRLAQELLELARVEAGQVPINVQPVDLDGLLRQQVDVARSRAAERHLNFELQVPSTLPPVQADPERVHQIVDNLVDNALKYAPAGANVRIVAEAENGVVRTAFSNPLGEHRPDPERIFDRFYRGDPSRSSSQAGVGLGLAISRELAMAQRGRLWADTDPDGNLRVWLVLPATPREAGPD